MPGTVDRAPSERIFRPDRPQLAQVRAALAECEDAPSAWELLAARGLVPMEWVDDPLRSFVPAPPDDAFGYVTSHWALGSQAYVYFVDPWRRRTHAHRTNSDVPGYLPGGRSFRADEELSAGDWVVLNGRFSVRRAAPGAPIATPPTLSAALTFASDVQGVTTAEALAREHFGDQHRPVRWRFAPDEALVAERQAAEATVRGAYATTAERDLLALGYFLRGAASRDGTILLVSAEAPLDDVVAADDERAAGG